MIMATEANGSFSMPWFRQKAGIRTRYDPQVSSQQVPAVRPNFEIPGRVADDRVTTILEQRWRPLKPAASPLETPRGILEAGSEMQWLSEKASELSAYRGEWLLIQGRMLVAHSTDFGQIQEAIRRRGIRVPFVYYVPLTEEMGFVS